jgi:hypothetical protein
MVNHLALLARETRVEEPGFLGMPALDLPSSAACSLGRYCNRETASNTFVLASQDTLQTPFTTRETVAVDTPASLATSFTVDARTSVSVGTLIIASIGLEGENRFRTEFSVSGLKERDFCSSLAGPKSRLPSPLHQQYEQSLEKLERRPSYYTCHRRS